MLRVPSLLVSRNCNCVCTQGRVTSSHAKGMRSFVSFDKAFGSVYTCDSLELDSS